MVANASNVILTRRGRIQGLNFAISKLYWILRRFAPQNDNAHASYCLLFSLRMEASALDLRRAVS